MRGKKGGWNRLKEDLRPFLLVSRGDEGERSCAIDYPFTKEEKGEDGLGKSYPMLRDGGRKKSRDMTRGRGKMAFL